jgi:hypothetical protein
MGDINLTWLEDEAFLLYKNDFQTFSGSRSPINANFVAYAQYRAIVDLVSQVKALRTEVSELKKLSGGKKK